MNSGLILKVVELGVAYLLVVVAFIVGLIAIANVGYLLVLLLSAALAVVRNRKQGTYLSKLPENPPNFIVVVPAHNEELVLEATLVSLKVQDYPKDRYDIVVIADNCTDTTAKIAAHCAVTVWERFNENERGKGYALAWAFNRLLNRPNDATQAYAIVDADTHVAPDFLAQMARYINAKGFGEKYALQGRYGVSNHQDGWRAALMSGAFDLINHIRPLGADYLGFLVGLKGNGMMFSRKTLETVTWGNSLTEDIDFGLDLIRAGIPMHYVPQAVVRAQMPVTSNQAASQRKRWEMGRFQLVREKGLPLIGESFRRQNGYLFEAGYSLMIMPLAEQVMLGVTGAISLFLAFLLKNSLVPIAQTTIMFSGIFLASAGVGLLVYILGGLNLAEAKKDAYLALMYAPFYAIWKVILYISSRKKTKNGITANPEWVRTDRIAIAVEDSPESARESDQEKKPADETDSTKIAQNIAMTRRVEHTPEVLR